MRTLFLILVALTCIGFFGCENGKYWSKTQAHGDGGRFALTGLKRTLPGRAEPEELILRINTATGEAWILAAIEKDGKIVDRWARIPEPVKETKKLPSGKEYTIEENVEAPQDLNWLDHINMVSRFTYRNLNRLGPHLSLHFFLTPTT